MTEQTEEEAAAEGETQEFVSYTATEDQLTDEVLARVVASCGGKELDNRMLDFYYWQQYYTFANNYGAYLSYLMGHVEGTRRAGVQRHRDLAAGVFDRRGRHVPFDHGAESGGGRGGV